MSLHPRRRTFPLHVVTIVWLTSVWVLLWGDLSFANVAGGLAVALVVAFALPMPAIEFHGRIHLPSLLYLIYRFMADLVVASVQVSAQAMDPRRTPHGAVIAVQLRSHSDLYLTLTGELCSLVPGTIVVEAHRTTGMLYLHVLDIPTVGGVEAARESVLATEARIMRAIASDEELAAAGLSRRPGRGERRGRRPEREVSR